jgi:hypothetical protein
MISGSSPEAWSTYNKIIKAQEFEKNVIITSLRGINFKTSVHFLQCETLEEIWDFVTNEFATSCDYLTFIIIVGYIYNYCLHLKPLATTL